VPVWQEPVEVGESGPLADLHVGVGPGPRPGRTGRNRVAVAAVTIVLDEHTRGRLSRTARPARAPARDVLQAKIALAAADGPPNTRIAAGPQIGVDTAPQMAEPLRPRRADRAGNHRDDRPQRVGDLPTVPDHARHRVTPEGRQQVVLVAVAAGQVDRETPGMQDAGEPQPAGRPESAGRLRAYGNRAQPGSQRVADDRLGRQRPARGVGHAAQ
jgi:hypothetical protein